MSAQGYLEEQGFQDPYSFSPFTGNYDLGYENYGQDGVSTGKSIWEKIVRFFGGTDNEARYNEFLAQRDRDYEREATNSARAWDLWMDSTKVQRLMKDIQAAGLNPWLALQGSGFNTSNTSTAGQGSSARSHATKEGQSNLGGLAMLLMGAAKLIAALG